MPRRTVWIRDDDIEAFEAITDRPKWLHDAIQAYSDSLKQPEPVTPSPPTPQTVPKPVEPPKLPFRPTGPDNPTNPAPPQPIRPLPSREEHYRQIKAKPGPKSVLPVPQTDAERKARIESYFPKKDKPLQSNELYTVPDLPATKHIPPSTDPELTYEPIDSMP